MKQLKTFHFNKENMGSKYYIFLNVLSCYTFYTLEENLYLSIQTAS